MVQHLFKTYILFLQFAIISLPPDGIERFALIQHYIIMPCKVCGYDLYLRIRICFVLTVLELGKVFDHVGDDAAVTSHFLQHWLVAQDVDREGDVERVFAGEDVGAKFAEDWFHHISLAVDEV